MVMNSSQFFAQNSDKKQEFGPFTLINVDHLYKPIKNPNHLRLTVVK